MNKRITVTHDTKSGRNTRFHDNRTGRDMSRAQFVSAIKNGNYPDYHVRKVNGIATPVSNPDGRTGNNLG